MMIEMRYYTVFPKRIYGLDEETLLNLFCKIKKENGLLPLFVPLHKNEDVHFCRALCARLPWAFCTGAKSTAEVYSLLDKSAFSLCMRLHAAVFSAARGCPVIAISDDAKLEQFAAGVSGGAFFSGRCSAEELYGAAKAAILNREKKQKLLGDFAKEQEMCAKGELLRLCDCFFAE